MSPVALVPVRVRPDEVDAVELGPRVAAHIAVQAVRRDIARQVVAWHRRHEPAGVIVR